MKKKKEKEKIGIIVPLYIFYQYYASINIIWKSCHILKL